MLELSVIIPTHNRLERLKLVLQAFERQSYPLTAFEIIVVSDASTDGTNAFLSSIQTPLHIRAILQEHGGPAKARNTGVTNAQGIYILFVDDDVVPSPTLIAEHMRSHHGAASTRVVLGPMLSPHDFSMAPWVRWEQAMLMKQYTAMQQGKWLPTARQFYTGNTSLRRELIISVGGFNENFRRAEDVELAYRLNALGVEYVFNPQAIGYHYAHRSFKSWIEIPYVYGRNDVIFATSHGQDWLLPKALKEFGERHLLIRTLVRLCLGRPHLSEAAMQTLQTIAAFSDRLNIEVGTRMAYSGLFGLRYYQGMADELGDNTFLSHPLARHTDPATTLNKLH